MLQYIARTWKGRFCVKRGRVHDELLHLASAGHTQLHREMKRRALNVLRVVLNGTYWLIFEAHRLVYHSS